MEHENSPVPIDMNLRGNRTERGWPIIGLQIGTDNAGVTLDRAVAGSELQD